MDDKFDIASLPRMVKWFTPGVLATTAARHIVSSIFGQFADHRMMQATVDGVSLAAVKPIVARHDYSAKANDLGEFWFDYVADLGDGFDSTYAVASTISKPELEIKSAGTLRAGQLLIMGGDQVYPFPSQDAYKQRLVLPYSLALPETASGKSRRDLFAIPGNHDWYDGLSAFDDTFCKARFQDNEANRIGGWRCRQHRSYFALKLPHNWWIWGADVQLAQHLDAGQVIYFDAVAEEIKRCSTAVPKIILCIAEPSWCLDNKGMGNLDTIMEKATNAGGRIFAVLAGDFHHYCRYVARERGVHLITAGGGGAYTAPTHQLADKLKLDVNGAKLDLDLQCKVVDGKETKKRACYPSKPASRNLSLALILFPFRNYGFAVVLGFLYWITTWMFGTSMGLDGNSIDKFFFRETQKADAGYFWWVDRGNEFFLKALFSGIGNVAMGASTLILFGILYAYCDVKRTVLRVIVTLLHTFAHLATMIILFAVFSRLNAPVVQWLARHEDWRSWLNTMLDVTPREGNDSLYQLTHALLYPWEMMLAGGVVGGMVWGLYFAICCYFGAHSDQAFASLRLTSYKNFLRMKVTADTLTIYPIGLRTTPSRRSWRWAKPAADGALRGPKIVSSSAITPELIEGPVVVKVSDVHRANPTIFGA